LDASLDAVGRLDPDDLAIELQRAAVQMPFVAFAESVATPLLHEIGARWKRGELGPAQEHVASAVLRRVLSDIVHRCVPRPDAPALIVGTPMGERHELGALMVAACAAACGWRVTYWGADLPADQIARTARELQADVVALSIVCSTSDARLRADLDALLGALPPHCQVILGGASAVPYARQLALLGAVRFESLSALDRFLADRAAPP
jgi:methanogenic corrinoid protein MtbC1